MEKANEVLMILQEWQLKQRQSLPLELKIELSKLKIQNFYTQLDGQVYISFSGGKDSTVLLHLVRSLYPEVPAVFVDTGLEYPEIREFVRTIDNVTIIKPKMNFKKVLEIYGFPIGSKLIASSIRKVQNPTDKNQANIKLILEGIKRDGTKSKYFKLPNKWRKLINSPFRISEKCCDIIKKEPFHKYQKETKRNPFIGTMASDSRQRKICYLRTGCNSFNTNIISRPMGFWLEKDVWEYIHKYNITYSKIYDMGYNRTGCMFCMFGVHMETEPNRFQLMEQTHPKLYDYCINKLELNKILDFMNINYTNNQMRFQ